MQKVKRSSTHTASPSRASSTSSTAPRKISKPSKLKALESSEVEHIPFTLVQLAHSAHLQQEESDVALVHKASVRKGKTRIVSYATSLNVFDSIQSFLQVESESDEDTEVAKGVAGAKRKKSASRTVSGTSVIVKLATEQHRSHLVNLGPSAGKWIAPCLLKLVASSFLQGLTQLTGHRM